MSDRIDHLASFDLPMDHQIARTLAILHEMSKGRMLKLTGTWSIGMVADDMAVGMLSDDGSLLLAEMTLSQLNASLNRHGVGMPIPTDTKE